MYLTPTLTQFENFDWTLYYVVTLNINMNLEHIPDWNA